MSATDWHECPICKAAYEKKKKDNKIALEKAYTERPAATYNILKKKLDEELKEMLPSEDYDENCTVREDSEVSLLDNGDLWFIHKFHCETCGTTWKDERTIKPDV